MSENKADPLLPCPFCGSTKIDAEGWASTDRVGPACDDCGATADTVDIWNSRPTTRWRKTVAQYVAEYEFRGDGTDHVPTEDERTMIEDAIEGYLASAPQPAAPLGGRDAIDTAVRAYFQSRFAPVQLSSDGVERVYCNGFPLNGLIDAILAAIPQERAELLDRIRAKAQSRVEYWKQISPHNFDGGHMDMLIGQFQTIANDIAAFAAELPLVATTDRAAIIEECLEAAHIGFEESMSQYALIGPGGMAMAIINAIRALGKETGL